MKQFFLLFFILQFLFANSQGVLGDDRNLTVEAYDLTGKRIPLGEQMSAIGNKMLNDQFSEGIVKFQGSPAIYHLMINFSLLDNELYFKKDSLILAFEKPVDSFSMIVKNKGITKIMNFKRGYPESASNSKNSFYEILINGPKLQLLDFHYKVEEERYSYGGPITKEYAERHKFFIYDVIQKTISEISPTLKSIKKSLPLYSSIIEKFTDDNKIKTSDNLASLVTYINENSTTNH